MEHEFVSGIETWGSGGQMLDLVTLNNGEILLVTDEAVILYDGRSHFEAGIGGRSLCRQRQ